MPERSASQHVPKDLQARFNEVAQLTDVFCQAVLNDEYTRATLWGEEKRRGDGG